MSEAASGPLVFGRYEVLFRIAQGGMAEVFAARMTGEGGFEKVVAIKRMLAHLESDAEMERMFLDEARLAGSITSPHVVQTLDIGRARDGGPFIVMELVVGASLADLVQAFQRQGQDMPVDLVFEICAQAALGLHAAHEARNSAGDPLQIVHRDVSPQNIMVGIDGRVRIHDFGIAHAASRLHETVHGQLKGKFAYMSPEQARGEAVDRRTDIYALAIVAWEGIAGRRLFPSSDPNEVLAAARRPVVPSLHQLRAGLPDWIDDVLASALSVEPGRRPATAAQLATVLRNAATRWRHGHPVDGSEIGELVAGAGVHRVAELAERLRRCATDVELHTMPIALLDRAAASALYDATTDVDNPSLTPVPDTRPIVDPLAPIPTSPAKLHGLAPFSDASTVLLAPNEHEAETIPRKMPRPRAGHFASTTERVPRKRPIRDVVIVIAAIALVVIAALAVALRGS